MKCRISRNSSKRCSLVDKVQQNTKIILKMETVVDKRIAIVQTGSWGDNINSTLMLPPIKRAYQNSIIDVHTSTLYASAFDNNPHITNIITYHADTKDNALHLGKVIPGQLSNSGYDIIFAPHPMLNHGNWTSIKHPELGDNIICAWIRALEHANIEYDWPLETILQLTTQEVANVDRFMGNVQSGRRRTIMEIQGESGQTHWNNSWTDHVVNKLCSRGEIVFISHKTGVKNLEERYKGLCYNVNHLTIRECAELYNRCNRFISVSSGLSNACNTNWCRKDVEWIEVINSPVVSSAPIRSAGKTFWYENDLHKFVSFI